MCYTGYVMMKKENNSMNKEVICQCCKKKYSIHEDDAPIYTICPFCNWENDPTVHSPEDKSSVNNNFSIREYRDLGQN